MSPRTLSALLSICLLLGIAGTAPIGAQEGWRLPGLDGGELTADDVASGSTVLVLWAGWSPRCDDIVERVNDLVSQWGNRARIVTVNFQEPREEIEAFLAGKGLRAPVYLDRDGSFAKAHRVSTLPGLVVYREGEVRYQGKLPDDASSILEEALS